MYKLIKTDGTTLGYTERVNYIKISTNGCYVFTEKESAIGVAYNSTPYNLLGHNDIENADTVIVKEEDIGVFAKSIEQNAANIDYLSMMAGIDFPVVTEEEVTLNE